MRYAGGGVGHYKVTLTDTPANAKANEIQEVFAVDDDITADTPGLRNLELEERIIVAEAAAGLEEVGEAEQDEDHCSDLEGDEDDEENPDEDDYLGADDGEGGFLDAEDDEGYAAL